MNPVITEKQKEALKKLAAKDHLLWNEPLANHTTFKVGGPAEVFFTPTEEELLAVVGFCRREQLPLTVLGNGSNVLVSDEGLSGVTVRLGKEMGEIRVKEPLAGPEDRAEELKANTEKEESDPGYVRIIAQAGAMLSAIAQAAAGASLTGMEFASGIPGTFGGAILMNAGAYGGELKDILFSATVLTESGEYRTYGREELELSYRHSRFTAQTENDSLPKEIIVSGELRLKQGNEEEIRAAMKEFNRRRVEKQPLEYPSAGSTFKRPEGYFAGKLIEDAGLRGYAVGDAQVSEKHCGFVVNKGNATAAQIVSLIRDVQRIVKETQRVDLCPEVRYLGMKGGNN